MDSPEISKWLSEALALPTNNEDSHPCLADRLRAIGVRWSDAIPSTTPLDEAASRTLLGESEIELAARLDAAWRDVATEWWTKQHRRLRTARERVAARAADAAASSRTEEWTRLAVLVETADDELVVTEMTRFLGDHPAHSQARFVLGRALLAGDDDRGIEMLERAMADDPRVVPAACALIRDHLQRKGRAGDAKPYERRAHDADERLALATRERTEIDHTTPLLSHGFDGPQLDDLRAIFAGRVDVRFVDMARARLNHLPAIPVYLVAVTLDGAWWQNRRLEGETAVRRAIEDVLPVGADVICFVVRSDRRRLAKHVARQPDARIYEKDASSTVS